MKTTSTSETKKLSVIMNAKTHKELRQASVDWDTSMNSIVIEAINEKLEQLKKLQAGKIKD